MATQYDSSGRAVADASNIVVTTGVASIGGGVGLRITVDETTGVTKQALLRHLQTVRETILKQSFPAS